MKGWTLCVEREGQYRKLAKIQFTKEGGFSIVMPYHKARKGLCLKVPHDPVSFRDSGFHGFIPGEFISDYHASSRVKLTYHADGFVQFSAESDSSIRSGRYVDGSPKGLGIFVNPLQTPITSGPSVGIVCWGANDYDLLRRESSSSNYLKITDGDILSRRCNAKDWDGYQVEILVFSHIHSRSIYSDLSGRDRLFLTFPSVDRSFAYFNFFVIRIPKSPSFLGLLFHRFKGDFGVPSGFSLSGPTDFKWSLRAIYPLPDGYIAQARQTLDYDSSTIEKRLREKKYRMYREMYQFMYFIRTKDDGLWMPENILRDEVAEHRKKQSVAVSG